LLFRARANRTEFFHPVEYAPKADSGQITSCMGKNTPERKDYIMENLVMTVEEQGRF